MSGRLNGSYVPEPGDPRFLVTISMHPRRCKPAAAVFTTLPSCCPQMTAPLAAKQKQRILKGGVPAASVNFVSAAEQEGVAARTALEGHVLGGPPSTQLLGAGPELEAFKVEQLGCMPRQSFRLG